MREKIERSSVRDRESRRVIGRRFKMLGAFLGFLAMLVFVLAITRRWRRNEYATMDEIVRSADWAGMSEKGGGQEASSQERERQRDDEGLRAGAKTRPRFEELTARGPVVDVDATLRLFDEL